MSIDLAPTPFYAVNPAGGSADGTIMPQGSPEKPWRRPLPQRLRMALNLGVLCCFLAAGLLIAWIRASEVAGQAQDQLHAEARAVATGMAQALVQQDRVDIRALLESMVHRRDFAAVAIYDTAGKRIAAYAKSRALVEQLPPVMVAPSTEEGFFVQHFPATLLLHEPVQDQARPLGTVVLYADLGARWYAFYGEMTWICAALLLSLLLCAALVNLVQQRIVEPVYHLERTCRVIVEDRDYTLRGWKAAHDEVGTVVDCVNHLLDEVHRRGLALVEARGQIAKALASSPTVSTRPSADESQARTQFLSNMCHELRTPLNRAGTLCRDLMASPLTAAQRETVSAVQSTGDLLIALLDDLLDYTRLESGRLEIQSQEFDPRETVDTVVRMHTERARIKRLTIAVAHAPAVPARVRGDRARLRQVIGTLVGNAIKYAQSGEIQINQDVQETSDAGVVLRIEVLDHGFGIAEEARQRVLEALTHNRLQQGLPSGSASLGITIANHLIERMGGTLSLCETQDGRAGFSFCVRFEAAAVESSQTARPAVVAPVPEPAAAPARTGRARRSGGGQTRRRTEREHVGATDDNMLPQWTEVYLDSAPELFESLRQAVAGDSVDAVREAAHLLGTCSSRVGATQVADHCRAMEQSAADGDLPGLRKLFEELTGAFERARASLALESAARRDTPQLSPHRVSTTLQ